MTKLEKRLLGLMQLGGSLHGADGHIWLECADKEYNLYEIFNENGIAFNNKIYGGILEALDTIDYALEKCGEGSLESMYIPEMQFMGKNNVAENRVSVVQPWRGGIF